MSVKTESKVYFFFNPAYDSQNEPMLTLKISSHIWEINIDLKEQELDLLTKVKNARWDERDSIIIGKCLNSPVFWSCQERKVSILIGHDDECWDICVSIEKKYLKDLESEIEKTKEDIKEPKFWI